MAKYAHIKNGAVYRIVDLISGPPPNKAAYILPYVETPRPSYDPVTEHPPVRQPDDIQANQVVQVWAAPVAKTAQELDDEKEEITSRIDLDPYLKAFALVMLDEINLLRQQHSLADRTPAQLRAAVKSKL